MKKNRSWKKLAGVVLSCVLTLLIAGDWFISVMVYNENFGQRMESYEPLMLRVEDFEGLQRTKYTFPSDKGQMLTGYLYRAGEDQHGIVVLAHGIGAGHNSYMDCANYFAQNGYYVFAYDATGSDESEGEGVGGLPQGVIDLDHAITFVEENAGMPNLPIVLFGHSWGGYCVCSVLQYHPEVKAVIDCAGFDRSSDIFEAVGKELIGNGIYLMMPFVKLHERIQFGSYASSSASKGISASEAAVMVVHSVDDETVPITYGYDVLYERYGDDPRVSFVRFMDRGHNAIFTGADTYKDELNAALAQWRDTLDYDNTAQENQARFAADKAAFIHANLDRAMWSHRLDEDLFAQFVSFYDRHVC